MKKTVLVMVLLAALCASCKDTVGTDGGDSITPLPAGVHILGVPAGKPFVRRLYYWSGGNRINLDLPDDAWWLNLSDGVVEGLGFPIPQLTVSGGKVLVTYPGECYWLDGVCHPLKRGSFNGIVESAEIVDGEVRIVSIDSFSAEVERVMFQDGVINSFTTKDGITYSVGCYGEDEKLQACYWIDGVRYVLNVFGWATSIYVEE